MHNYDTSYARLYRAYKDLRKNEHGQLNAAIVSNDPAKVAVYKEALAAYRTKAFSNLNTILRRLSEDFMEEYTEELQNR